MLSAELKSWGGAEPALHPVGELLDRHWEAAFLYARLCTDGERAAGMLTTAAFTRLFGESQRHDGPTAAWRPHLLVTVRRIAAEWSTDGRRDLLHPGLRVEDADLLAARLLPPLNRRLLSRSFQRLSPTSRCLLWHVEVESEPLGAPASLLGLDTEGARVELRRARERLREELLQSHRELAVEEECHRYDRLLDAASRRGDGMGADLRGHLDRCRHCAYTADQLACFTEGAALGTALAEGTLGWAAHAYQEVRAGAGEEPQRALPGEDFEAPTSTDLVVVPGGGSVRAARKAARRTRRRNLAVAVLTVSGLVVLPLVLWSASGSGDGGSQAGERTEAPRPGKDTAPNGPSWIDAGDAVQGTLRGRLHNVFSGQCIGIKGGKAVAGAEAVLGTCSSVASQQWSYETNGLLRNGLAPGLCLDSHLGYSVVLTPCTDPETEENSVRYDFTLQGTLVPRWSQDLALAPAATDGSGALVAKSRADSAAQRWVIDTSKPDLQMQIVNWDTAARTPGTAPATPKKAAPRPTPTPTPTPPKKTDPKPAPSPTPTPSASNPQCSPYNPYACGGYGNGGYGTGYPGYPGYPGYGWGGYGYGGYGRP